ncbi:MAG: hypothetical protein HRT61_23545 [Ekhidna sp.]|nr:hypothetical protein [Ekhidna sp.]
MRLAKQIANTFLAITLLIATTGITLNKHYCMGRLKSIAINEVAKKCNGESQEKMPCCNDVSQQLKVEEITTSDFDFDSAPDLYEVALISFVLLDDNESKELKNNAFQHYSPPPPEIDVQSGFQVFLI